MGRTKRSCLWVITTVNSVWLLIAATTSAQESAKPVEESTWKVGVSTVDITPKDRLTLAGYAFRTEPAEGVESKLSAKTLYIEDGQGGRVLFITLDLIGVDRELRDYVTKQLEERFQLPSEAVVMNASHTHCGPSYTKPEAAGYLQSLRESLVRGVEQAIASSQPAALSYSHAKCSFAMNRRTSTASGFQNHPNPDGSVDPTVPVLRVDNLDGTLRAVLFGYACHNTTLSFRKWCADYAGYAQTAIETDHPGCTALFMMGCGGDQNPYPRSTVAYAEQHGRTLATAVEAALETNQKQLRHQHPVRGKIQTRIDTVNLEYADARTPLDYPIQIVRLGHDVELVALASEVTIDYALRLQRELSRQDGPAVWIAGYSNAMEGYIPSRRILVEGGYEAESRPWQLSIEARIIDKVHEMSAAMYGETLFRAEPFTAEHVFTKGIEGPAADGKGNLFVVNYEREQTIGKIDAEGKAEVFVTLPGKSVGNGIRFDELGNMFIADYVEHNVLIVPAGSKTVRVLAHNAEMSQPNDLALAADGTLFASDPNWQAGTGKIWRVDRDGIAKCLIEDMGTTNGIDLSPDNRRLYVNESASKKIWIFDLTREKTLTNKRLFREFNDFGFDGMRVDIDGSLYVTRYGKGTVVKLSPEGDIVREIDVLGSKPSNICFGGPDGRTAFVTEVEHGRVVKFRVDRPGLQW